MGLWSNADAPSPPPYPVGTPDEEYYSGMRAMRPHVDHFVPAHNLASLADLAALLADGAAPAPGLSSRR